MYINRCAGTKADGVLHWYLANFAEFAFLTHDLFQVVSPETDMHLNNTTCKMDR